MELMLDPEELVLLKRTLDRSLRDVERELVRTDAPSLQHALNADFEKLHTLRKRLDS